MTDQLVSLRSLLVAAVVTVAQPMQFLLVQWGVHRWLEEVMPPVEVLVVTFH